MRSLLKKYGAALAALCTTVFLSCATQVAPSGGPEDKLPPRIAGVYPAPNTTNHPNELMIKLEFDEWINASVPRSAVSISPPIDKKLRFEVSGKTLVLTSRAVLDTGTTYTVTFAGGIKDLHGNALAKPFHVVFSTGSIIDSLTLSGRVLVDQTMARKKEYPSIGLFLMGAERESKHYLDKYRDTTTKELSKEPMLLKEPPLYVTRADSAGHFTLTGLKAGHYRVVAFMDGNGNQKIELSTEQVGLWTGDLELTAETKDTLWLAIADMDTTKLELSSVTQPYANVLEATFTRNVYFDSAFTDTSNCYLESPEKKKLYPKLVYLGSSTNRPQFYFDPAPKKEVLYKFICSAVERDRNIGLAARRPELEGNHVEHVGMALRGLHQETASRARTDVAAAVPDERLDLLAPVRAKSLRLFDRRAAGHHEDVRRVKCAATHRLAVHRRCDDVLRPRSKLKPAECADVASPSADEHGDPKRLFRVGSGNAVPRTRPHAPSSRGNHGNGNQRLNLHT